MSRVDFDPSNVTAVIATGTARSINLHVKVFDDHIHEAGEEYFCMFLETDDPRVDLISGRFASLGIIKDNESKLYLCLLTSTAVN